MSNSSSSLTISFDKLKDVQPTQFSVAWQALKNTLRKYRLKRYLHVIRPLKHLDNIKNVQCGWKGSAPWHLEMIQFSDGFF